MPRCFVIGPIGDKFAPVGSPGRVRYEEALQVFESVILPACQAHDLEPVRADQIAVTGEITEQVFRHLLQDEVVIADVSNGNPNVMYELGLRHTRDLLTIQIGEYGQLPFDVAAIRTIMFSRSERGLIDARNQLQHALAIGLSEGPDPVTATRVWSGMAAGPIRQDEEATETDDRLGEETIQVEVDGLLEQMAVVEETLPQLTVTAESIGEVINAMGTEAEESGREFEALNARGAASSERLSAVVRFARRIDEPINEMVKLTDSFVSQMQDIDGAVNGILAYLENNPEALDEDSRDFLTGVISMGRSTRTAMEDLGQFASVVEGLGSLSKSLRRPGKRISEAIGRMAKAVAVVDDWESRAMRLRRDPSAPAAPDGGSEGAALT